jgi:hypothetical protein
VSLLQDMIFKSYLLGSQVPPEGMLMLMSIQAWGEALSHIPDEYLSEYFTRATRRKKGGFVVNAYDICEEWDRLERQRHYDSLMAPEHRGRY